MADLMQWFQSVLIEPSAPFAGTTINLLQILKFIVVLSLFLFVARVLRRLLRRFFTRLSVEQNKQEQVIWLVSIGVVLLGVVGGLALIGVDMTVLGRALTYSIPIGQTDLSLAKLLLFLAVVLGAVVLARYLRLVLRTQVLPPFQLPENTQFLLLRSIDVGTVVLGVFLGLNLTGLSLSSLFVVLGGLGIGIGFGLQNIASNLISGLILIFERPIRIGDRVTVGGTLGTVSAINLRSTVIVTYENINMIVPNSQFISEPVTNWTYGDKMVRIKVPVGVVYGSDTALVKRALLEVARDHPEIIKAPNPYLPAVKEPFVWFVKFGESSLDFELFAWIPDVQRRLQIVSDLHFMIDEKFRESGIVIAFPQRDVHLYYESAKQPPLGVLPDVTDSDTRV